MNLVATAHYKRVPNYRDLTPQEEWDLLENHYNRVTDTCIPEEEAFRRLQQHIGEIWKDADAKAKVIFRMSSCIKSVERRSGSSTMKLIQRIAGCLRPQKKIFRLLLPGWEDSTMGNIFASYIIKEELKASTMKSGIEYMVINRLVPRKIQG